MNPRERTRFHNLLKLAAESPFAGERQSALAAAERLAARFGMTLDEAAAARHDEAQARPADEHEAADRASPFDMAPESPAEARRWARDVGQAAHLHDTVTAADKERRARAMRAAFARGLDQAAIRRRARPSHHRRGSRRMSPQRFAKTLLRETRLPFREIAALTGLTVHAVVALKLQMRPGSPQEGGPDAS
ncbi:MAG: hypothetical protein RIB84_15135 [Sneathiellaceae bacterium]